MHDRKMKYIFLRSKDYETMLALRLVFLSASQILDRCGNRGRSCFDFRARSDCTIADYAHSAFLYIIIYLENEEHFNPWLANMNPQCVRKECTLVTFDSSPENLLPQTLVCINSSASYIFVFVVMT